VSEQDPELEAFSRLIVALEPWLGEVVLVGGRAHRLYRVDSRARKLDYLPRAFHDRSRIEDASDGMHYPFTLQQPSDMNDQPAGRTFSHRL
jgi:hypothetical protein